MSSLRNKENTESLAANRSGRASSVVDEPGATDLGDEPPAERMSLTGEGPADVVLDRQAEEASTAGVASSVFNLSNCVLGSGTLAMPYACYNCGVGVYLLLLVFFGSVANFTIQLLVICTENVAGMERVSYAALAAEVRITCACSCAAAGPVL